MKRSHVFFMTLIAVACLLSPRILYAQIPSSPRLTEMLQKDPRLAAKQVTVYLPYASVGEILEQWSAQTGVALAPDERDGARDVLVCALLKDMPLHKAMSALVALLSYKNAEWVWERVDGSGSGYQYVLHQTPAARSLADRLAEQIQNDFEKHAADLIAAARLSPEEQRKVGERDPVLGSLLSREEIRRGVLAFANSLTPDQQHQLLHDHTYVDVDMTKLSPEGQQLANDYVAHQRLLNPNAVYNNPTRVEFSVGPTDLTPSMFVLVGTNNGGFEGYPYIGSKPFNDKWRDRLVTSWMLTGDLPTQKAKETPLVSKEAARERPEVNALLSEMDPATKRGLNMRLNAGLYLRELTPMMRLVQLTAATGLPVLARVPRQVQGGQPLHDIKSPYGKTVGNFLLTADAYLMSHKWHEGVLLLTSHRRLVEKQNREYPSWPLLRETRERLKENQDGTLSLAAMTQIVSRYSREQLTAAASIPSYRSLKTTAALAYPLLAMIGRRPEVRERITSPQGVADAEACQIAATLFQMSAEAFQQSKGRVVRIREGKGEIPMTSRGLPLGVIPTRVFTIELLTLEGAIVKSVSMFETKDVSPDVFKDPSPARGRSDPF